MLNVVETRQSGNPDMALWNALNDCFINHSGMGNFLYCDGHVKTKKWATTMTPYCEWRFDGVVQGYTLPSG